MKSCAWHGLDVFYQPAAVRDCAMLEDIPELQEIVATRECRGRDARPASQLLVTVQTVERAVHCLMHNAC